MADGKTVNVKIQYNVDSTQVQKAEQLLRQAQAATNQFQASAQKAGQSTSNAFSQANRSILSMEMELARLKTQISVASNPAAVKKLSDQYKELAVQLREATKKAYELPKAIKESDKATKSLTSSFGQFVTAAKLFITAGIVREAVNLTLEMAKLSGNVEGVERAFQRTFPNSEAMLEKLRQSTHGTIDDFQLMQKALKAQNLGVPIQNLGTLLEFAATRAQQTGDSVDYLVNSIIDGLGRKSILKLDNLGVSATRLKDAMGGISTQAATVAQVTEAFSKVAGEELQKMGGYAETSATKVDQLTVAVEELKIALSRKADTSNFIQFLTDSVEGLTMLAKGEEKVRIETLKTSASQKAQAVIESDAFKALERDQQKRIDFIQQEMNTRVQTIGRYNDEIKALQKTIDQGRGFDTGSFAANQEGVKRLDELVQQYGVHAKQAFREEIEGAEKAIVNRRENKFVVEQTILILKEYLAEIQKITEAEGDGLGLIEALENRIESLGESVKKAKTHEEIAKLNAQLVGTQFQLRELQELGKTQINPFASLIYDLKNINANTKFRLKQALPTTEEIQSETAALTQALNQNLKEKMGQVGQESASSFLDHFRITVEGFQNELLTTGIDIFADQLISFETAELASLQSRLNNLRNFYDEQMILAGDNERAKEEMRLREERESAGLQRKIAEQERKARRFSIIIDTAAGIAKAFATSTTIYQGIVNAALVAAQGASQLAIVNRTPARFAKGGLNIQGPGTGTSDSIDARISKGESVMTANEWKTSKNVLKEVRAKTLDDKVLSDLKLTKDGVKYVGMDDKNIVKEIRDLKNSFPDVEARGNLLYTTRRKSENYKQWIRKSSMSQ